MNVFDQISKARGAATPLMGVTTPDQPATIRTLTLRFAKDLNDTLGEGDPETSFAAVQWDVVRGLTGLNPAGHKWVTKIDPEKESGNPVTALLMLPKLPEYAVCFMQNMQRHIDGIEVSQAVFNLRDEFKQHLQTLILLGPSLPLPAELRSDVQIFDEPLPSVEELISAVDVAYQSNDLPKPARVTAEKAAGQLMGLSSFAAEQVAMMSMGEKAIEFPTLVERRFKTIDQNEGLKVYRGKEKFKDIGGLSNIKSEFLRVINGRRRPRLIIILEEMDKMFASYHSDSTGIAQYQMGKTLSFMQDTEAMGSIGIGPAGTGKSLVAKALGNEADIPAINIDFGAMQGGLVGVSQERTNNAFRVIEALSGGRAFFFGTCNKISVLPPEFRRRFRTGTYYFDIPNKEEKATIWAYYLLKYNFPAKTELPDDRGWTGAEIWQCCDKAWQYDLTPMDVAGTIIPVSTADPEGVAKLRREASGRYQSANYTGVYHYQDETEEDVTRPKMRKVR